MIGGNGEEPFVMKGKIKNNQFTAMIDSGSPVAIFTPKNLKEILAINFFVRPLWQSEINVDFNQQPLDIAGFNHVHLKVGKQELRRARIFVAAKGRLLVGSDWLTG